MNVNLTLGTKDDSTANKVQQEIEKIAKKQSVR